jgi:low affinity Fe/Cu permease
MRRLFRKIAHATAEAIGTPYAFILALSSILVWAALGPFAHFSDTWQLVINTSTTIITFLVVFMIQNSQNRDSKAVHLKLDELICAVKSARNRFVDVEDLEDDEIAELAAEFRRRRNDPDTPREVRSKIERLATRADAGPAEARATTRDDGDDDDDDESDDDAPSARVTH